MKRSLLAISLIAVMLVVAITPALAAPGGEPDLAGATDDRMDPLTVAQRELHAKALEAQVVGKAHGKTQ